MIFHNIDDSREFDICEDVISRLDTRVDSAVHLCGSFAVRFEGGLRSFAVRFEGGLRSGCVRFEGGLWLSLLYYYKNRNHFS